MTENWLEEKDDRLIKDRTPYLSFSRINRYLTCPESYRLHYIEGLRLKVQKANRVFGQLMHLVLAHLFNGKAEPVKFVFVYRVGSLQKCCRDRIREGSWSRGRELW
jgi:ATP-dependent helicase/DNAse subunit B